MDNKSEEILTKTYSRVFICGLRIPSRFSPCKTHSREMAQTSGFDPTTQVKTYFDCKMFDVANWVACLNGENGPGKWSQQSTTSQPPHLVSRSRQLQEQGFSVEVAERIAAPQRSSTRTIYKSKWDLFEKWCRENSVDFSTPL